MEVPMNPKRFGFLIRSMNLSRCIGMPELLSPMTRGGQALPVMNYGDKSWLMDPAIYHFDDPVAALGHCLVMRDNDETGAAFGVYLSHQGKHIVG